MSREYSGSLYNCIEEYVDDQGWKGVKKDDQNGIFRVSFGLKNKIKSVSVTILTLDTGFVAYATCPLSADEETMTAVAEFICRANYGLNYGNFELDFNDGEIRFKNAVPAEEDGFISSDAISFALDIPLYMWEKYGNALLSVLLAGRDPADAIGDVERR